MHSIDFRQYVSSSNDMNAMWKILRKLGIVTIDLCTETI